MLAVTAIDRDYLPGLIALHNSIKRNSPGSRLACMTYGDDDLARSVEALGIEVRHNQDINAHLPAGEGTEEGCKPMYARLLVPKLFGDSVWLDADQIVISDLSSLDSGFSEPIAAVPCYEISRTVIGMQAPEGDSIYSGLMVFNSGAWERERITERCVELMNDSRDVVFRFVVQSVLSVVLAGRFHRLDQRWQTFVNRPYANVKNAAVMHWHGRWLKPWTHPDMPHADIWKQYA